MIYEPKQQEYIDSVDGQAHMSAVDMIGQLELENKKLKAHPVCRYCKAEMKQVRVLGEGNGGQEESIIVWDCKCKKLHEEKP